VDERENDKIPKHCIITKRIRATSLLVQSEGRPSIYRVGEASGGRSAGSGPCLETASIGGWKP